MPDRTDELAAISPLDGRYRNNVRQVAQYFSEEALIRYRVTGEIAYLRFFFTEILHKRLSPGTGRLLQRIVDRFDRKEAKTVKRLELRTGHDVKAVEYYLRQHLARVPEHLSPLVHFGLTSEDTNSLALGLAWRDCKRILLGPLLRDVVTVISSRAEEYRDMVLLGRTHGQPAVPTTLGKECINIALRLHREAEIFAGRATEAKVTGAVGNYNAHVAAYPDIDWVRELDRFIGSLTLTPNHDTTQILPADSLVRHFDSLRLFNTILLGFVQDMWRYISDGYFRQQVTRSEVGSSTMPHKVNPIFFENAEGNLGLANALLSHFSSKLPVSRLQRDLSDSTVKRNIGSAVAYSVLAYRSCLDGLGRVVPDREVMAADVNQHWECLTEGIQTILRVHGYEDAYETTKAFSRGKILSEEAVRSYIRKLNVPAGIKNQLAALTPATYTGLAARLVSEGVRRIARKGGAE